MNTATAAAPATRARKERFDGGLPEFLDRLEKLYRCFGLRPADARAATLADAEIFAPLNAEPVGAP